MAASSSSSSNVRVFVRVRPLLAGVDDPPDQPCARLTARPAQARVALGSHDYRFDGVLDGSSSQADVFAAAGVAGMLDAVVSGYNATLFAYGQTGSGKTYTMDGLHYEMRADGRGVRVGPAAEGEEGVTLRAIDALFERLRARAGAGGGAADQEEAEEGEEEIVVRASFVQIYEEKVFDLLADYKQRKPLAVRYSRAKGGFHVPAMYVLPCTDAADARHLYERGVRARTVASHRLNATSSRSHSVFTLYVERRATLDDDAALAVTAGRFNFVDLAGSERLKHTESTGRVRAQGIQINASLFALRQVIKALVARDRAHVPYRDSTLTRLLMDALGGNSLTVMLACCAPGDPHVHENTSTLDYASLVRRVQNRAVVDEDPVRRLVRRLRAQVKNLKARLALVGSGEGALGLSGAPSSEVEEKFVAAVDVIRQMHAQLEEADVAREEVERANARLEVENAALRERALFLEELVGGDRDAAAVERENRDLRAMLVKLQLSQKQAAAAAGAATRATQPQPPPQPPSRTPRPGTASLRVRRAADALDSEASRHESLWFRPADAYVSPVRRRRRGKTATRGHSSSFSSSSSSKKDRRELLRALMSKTTIIRKP